MKTPTASEVAAKRPAYYIPKSEEAGTIMNIFPHRRVRAEVSYPLTESRRHIRHLHDRQAFARVRGHRPQATDRTRVRESVWKYGSDEDGYEYEFGDSPKRLYPEEKEEEPSGSSVTKQGGITLLNCNEADRRALEPDRAPSLSFVTISRARASSFELKSPFSKRWLFRTD